MQVVPLTGWTVIFSSFRLVTEPETLRPVTMKPDNLPNRSLQLMRGDGVFTFSVTAPPQEPRLSRGVLRAGTPRASHGSCLLVYTACMHPSHPRTAELWR